MTTKDNQEAELNDKEFQEWAKFKFNSLGKFDYNYAYGNTEYAMCRYVWEESRATLTPQVNHDSDCAVHNEPAYPKGKCDCTLAQVNEEVAFSDADLAMFQDNAERYNLTTHEEVASGEVESKKAFQDYINYGQSYMLGDKHIPLEEVLSTKNEPVAWANKDLTLCTTVKTIDGSMRNKNCGYGSDGVPLYLHPPTPSPSNVLVEALRDMLNGWIYIRGTHGDLYGVGWDRAQEKAEKALANYSASTDKESS